ncbi:MAG: pilus assembly protein PilM [Cyanobacteriota bacterium]
MAKSKATNVGISISTEWIELVQLSRDLKTIDKSVKLPMPMATMDPSGDRLRDPDTLAASIATMVAELNAKPAVKGVHISVPGTLVRIVEMPKIPKNELILALTSEAERYAIFNDTEALVDYEVISEEPDERQKIILVALRKDTVSAYREAFDKAKIQMYSLEVETISSLRGLKYTGNLDKVLTEVGDQPWGSIHFEPERIRIAVWHYDQIKNWREVLLDTSDLKIMGEDAPVIQDLVEEVRRTIGMTRPVLWLTYGIPESLSTSLTPRLGANVRPMNPGDKVKLDDPKLSLAAIGTCCKSYDKFPAFIDIKPAVDPESSGELMGSFKMMIAAAVALAILFSLGTLILIGLTMFFNMQLDTTNKKIQDQTGQIQQLTAEVDSLKKKATIKQQLSGRLKGIITHNQSISKITNAIKDRIPGSVWLENVVIEAGLITIKGKSTDYDSIIIFSKNFDEKGDFQSEDGSPIRDMALQEIVEEVDTQTDGKYYTFTMTGYPKN